MDREILTKVVWRCEEHGTELIHGAMHEIVIDERRQRDIWIKGEEERKRLE